MPREIPGTFKRFEFLTENEQFAASTFTEAQLAGLQNKLSANMQLKINAAAPDFPTTEDYMRNQEYLRGAIEALDLLFAEHDAATKLAQDFNMQRGQQE